MARRKPNTNFVLNAYSSLSLAQDDDEDDGGQLTPLCHPNAPADSSGSFFSRVKQSISSSPLGSILGQNALTPLRSNTSDIKHNNSNFNENRDLELHAMQDVSPALTPRCVSTVKHVFTPMPGCSPTHARSRTTSFTHSDASTDSSPSSVFASSFCTAGFSPLSLSSQPTLATSAHDSDTDDKWSPVLTSPSEAQTTPPLTPATSCMETTLCQSPKSAYSQTRSQRSASISIRDEEDTSCSSEDKKGKNPAPPFPYEALIADPSVPTATETEGLCVSDDAGAWWGLEYTLELSRRDSRASDTSSSTTGEHSKSRESWAAIHQGTVPPVYEDANFQDWQRWHRTLDKIELRRRRKRTIDFIEESEHLASLYLDEMLAQRAVQIHEDLLTEDEIYDALVWVEYAAERRPDPFFPPEKHNLGWVLKSHRSVACLCELQEQPFDEGMD